MRGGSANATSKFHRRDSRLRNGAVMASRFASVPDHRLDETRKLFRPHAVAPQKQRTLDYFLNSKSAEFFPSLTVNDNSFAVNEYFAGNGGGGASVEIFAKPAGSLDAEAAPELGG